MSKFDYMIKVDGDRDRIFIDQFDKDRLWLSIHVNGGSAYVTMTKVQGIEIVKCLQNVINAIESKQ